jgi:hypothetical protein
MRPGLERTKKLTLGILPLRETELFEALKLLKLRGRSKEMLI